MPRAIATGRTVRWPSALAAVALVASGCGGDTGPEPPDPDEGVTLFRFEKFAAAPTIEGGQVVLKSLAGKVVLLDLFGTWCPPCRRSTPVLVSLYARFHAQGLEIVGLAYEQTGAAQAAAAVEDFRREFSIPYILALGPDEVLDELREKTGARGDVPTLLLVDRQGVVRDLFAGLPPGYEAVLADRIERLLAEPAVPVPGAPD